jgi:hypothetical protein
VVYESNLFVARASADFFENHSKNNSARDTAKKLQKCGTFAAVKTISVLENKKG